jgi:BspA type Leucine rich repeat region (6 copies)
MNFNLFAALLLKVSRATKLLPVLLLLLPAVVQAQYAYSTNADGSIYTYSTNADGSANIVAYAGPPWVVTIPTNINGLIVTSIGQGAFASDYNLTSVTIPNSVTSIGVVAFGGCSSLTNVTISDSVTSIGNGAFALCTNLTSVTIGNGVTSIGDSAFAGDALLTAITVATNNPTYSSANGVLFDKSQTMLIQCPTGLRGSYTIPGSVTSIGDDAFYECESLTSVTIPGSVTSIGYYAFGGSPSLTSVYFTGNAPSPTNDSTVFSGVTPLYRPDPTTVYYLPGITGWGAMFDGRPTAPWFLPNPLILTHSASFGVQPGGFGFTISWATNASVVVQAATNLANPVWIPVSTSTLTGGTNYFSDPQWTNYPMRFYRAALAFTVGGTLTGLPAGDTVTLQDNGSDNLTLSNNGTFTFPTALPNGHAYSVTVSGTSGGTLTTYTTGTITANGSGTISGTNVTNVAVRPTGPALTGDMDLDMLNAAVADGTANGGVPAVMYTQDGGPFNVTAVGLYSYDVCLRYEGYVGGCKLIVIAGTGSCSSTTLPSGPAIQFGHVLECGSGSYGY